MRKPRIFRDLNGFPGKNSLKTLDFYNMNIILAYDWWHLGGKTIQLPSKFVFFFVAKLAKNWRFLSFCTHFLPKPAWRHPNFLQKVHLFRQGKENNEKIHLHHQFHLGMNYLNKRLGMFILLEISLDFVMLCNFRRLSISNVLRGFDSTFTTKISNISP